MKIVEREIVYSDEWIWNGEKDCFVNLMTGEEMEEDEFYTRWNNF